MNDELYHHGILGMRWGIRRTKSQLGYKTGNGKKDKVTIQMLRLKQLHPENPEDQKSRLQI